ncbi:ArdC family protein [Paenibacillus crassostreae]|uniref:Antirestriction protein n=1 Tax=Paenibacillus crassostreae TaxID=1763538 RepID=A0A167EJN3_9BACL|nr:zincin-like metallopeptidase domain-containing protein [Paenibacillus crassostreae]AOZ94926.1 antirestriction protein [Paenibacillus crassostreae]OAB75608.1 antirestriction protein [Paenibacillus crassostreae]
MTQKIYEMVTKRILEMLDAGVIPWRRPWSVNGAVNWKTQKPYRGINTLLLMPGEYATFKQIAEAGGKVKKGATSHIVVFWKWLEKENKDSNEKEKVPLLRFYRVFDIKTQCEGLESKRQDETFEHDPIVDAEAIQTGYTDAPPISFLSGRAYYMPASDHISIPPLQDYPKAEEYYSTLFHEMVHSTGHRSRLNRPGIEEFAAFGDENYSKEELIAEIGAAMLCASCGIDNSTIENSAAYIGSWHRKLKSEPSLIIQAAGKAQRAVDYILNVTFEQEA